MGDQREPHKAEQGGAWQSWLCPYCHHTRPRENDDVTTVCGAVLDPDSEETCTELMVPSITEVREVTTEVPAGHVGIVA